MISLNNLYHSLQSLAPMHRGLHLAAGSQVRLTWVIEVKLGAVALSMQNAQLAPQHLQTQVASTATLLGCLKTAHLLAHLAQLKQEQPG